MNAGLSARLVLPGAFVLTILVVALAAPFLDLPNPVKQDMANRLAGSMAGSPLGRDEFGRDVFSRLVWGARTSLTVAFAAAAIAGLIGTLMGMIGGYFRGLSEILTVRLADVILCFPPILLALLVVTILGPGVATLVLMLSILYIPGFVRVAYAETLSARGQDYVEAVRALGAGNGRILALTVLPNISGPLLVQASLTVAAAMVVESGLSFLGLGVVPPTPSWGLMIRGARTTMTQAPLLLLWPCLALTLTILAINLFCDALRDAVDPRTATAGGAIGLFGRLLPGLAPPAPVAAAEGLAVRGLSVEIETARGAIRPVDAVSFSVRPGETLGIVGESGSGKSVATTALIGLLPANARPIAGAAWFEGQDLLRLGEADMQGLRGRRLALISQDPMVSLNPVHRVGEQLIEAILAHRPMPRRRARAEALSLFRRVGIADPERRLDAFPHELSGGMRQRVMIAIALANRPALLIADEPTTALDVTIQAQILDLLADLKRDYGLSLIFISHSLGVVADIADHVAVMYAGQIVEEGPAADLFARPLHPYTRALIAAMPEEGRRPQPIAGLVPPPHAWPKGCRFAPRCGFARAVCEAPQALAEPIAGRRVRCVRAGELTGMALDPRRADDGAPA